jgi:hypothetical protein
VRNGLGMTRTKVIGGIGAVFVVLLVWVAHQRLSAAPAPAVSNTAFPNPQPVTILGYTGSAEVPYLTPDGNYLIFDDRTDPGTPNVKIHYAKRVNDTTFQYVGQVGNVNFPGTINFEMTLDDHNNFYFTRIDVPPHPNGQPSLYRGVWQNGTVTGIAPVPGLTQAPGVINQDSTPSHDGRQLIFDAWDYLHKCLSYKLAVENANGSFTVTDQSQPQLASYRQVFKNVTISNYLNQCTPLPYPGMTHSMLMGPVSLSHSGLAVVFTVIQPTGGMPVEKYYIATRSSTSQPFGQTQTMIANGRSAEGGSFSADDSLLYFHLSNSDGTFWPYVVKLRAKTAANAQGNAAANGTATAVGQAQRQ